MPAPVALSVSDTRSHVLALVDTTAPSWEEVPVLAGTGSRELTSTVALDGVEPGSRTARCWRSGRAPAGGARDGRPAR